MLVFLIILHVVICFALIFVVLIQTGKGGLDSNFGGIATNALGTQGANEFIKKWTKILLVAFVLSCILLASQVRGGTAGDGQTSRRRSRLAEEAHREMQNLAPSDEINFEGLPFEMNQIEVPIDVDQTEAPFEIVPQIIQIGGE